MCNVSVKDSYQEFFDYFTIDKEAFFKWGISCTIFPEIPKVASEWDALKRRVLNDEIVYIRKYGRDGHRTQLYKDLYKNLFGNSHIMEDPTNNAKPHKLIERLTGLKRNHSIYNYQVSHIWGHTKNLFMFEAPWNICYTPKIVDPFTGHETKGIWPSEYQKLFIAEAYELYRQFIIEYNQILIEFDVEKRVQEYIYLLRAEIPNEELTQFVKDVNKELSPIYLSD